VTHGYPTSLKKKNEGIFIILKGSFRIKRQILTERETLHQIKNLMSVIESF
jgi:hypothetical protein